MLCLKLNVTLEAKKGVDKQNMINQHKLPQCFEVDMCD